MKPVLSLKSKVILLRKIKKGDSVGDNQAFLAERDSVIAIVPIGYADGYPRSLTGGKCYVLINGQEAPVIGRVCMDQLAIDVTDMCYEKVTVIIYMVRLSTFGRSFCPRQ